MRIISLIVVTMVYLLNWNRPVLAKPPPTMPVDLTEEQQELVISRVKLPFHDVKVRQIGARAMARENNEPREIMVSVETEYYEQTSTYRRYFEVDCHWRALHLPDSLSCPMPTYVVDLLRDRHLQKIDVGRVGEAPPMSIEEVIEVAEFLRSRYGGRSMLTGLRAASFGYRAYVGGPSCIGGGIEIMRGKDRSLSIGKINQMTCI